MCVLHVHYQGIAAMLQLAFINQLILLYICDVAPRARRIQHGPPVGAQNRWPDLPSSHPTYISVPGQLGVKAEC